VRGSAEHYSWAGHVNKYLRYVHRACRHRRHPPSLPRTRSRLPALERLVVCDIDNTLIGDADALGELIELIQASDGRVGFGVATGRRLESAIAVLEEWGVPTPDVLITAVGSELHYGHGMVEDLGWQRHINYRWKPDALREAMTYLPGLKLQPKTEQRAFKLSYYVDTKRMPRLVEIRRHLRQLDLHAKLIYSHEAYLDLLPVRASKGLAIRYLAMKWGIPPEALLVAGDSGNDEEMLSGNTLGVVVGNYSPELQRLHGRPRIYFAQEHFARGIIEGIDHYDFLGKVRIPSEE
jgi:sucrose-phosphate synthase